MWPAPGPMPKPWPLKPAARIRPGTAVTADRRHPVRGRVDVARPFGGDRDLRRGWRGAGTLGEGFADHPGIGTGIEDADALHRRRPIEGQRERLSWPGAPRLDSARGEVAAASGRTSAGTGGRSGSNCGVGSTRPRTADGEGVAAIAAPGQARCGRCTAHRALGARADVQGSRAHQSWGKRIAELTAKR